MKILSLFDGMSCGMLAMLQAGVNVDRYVAYEIDKYAIQTSRHNFPMIEQCGDVFEADFTQYKDFDFLVGGSPCTYWSIAQTKNRETVASGMGWELFSQYIRALKEAKPKYFIYENNKSMSKQIRASIDEAFGFEAVCINSALVSAQNRQRLYWVGRRNEDGTYSKVNVEQPEDRGILLKDVLDGAVAIREKAHAVIASAGRTTEREFFLKSQGNMVAEPIKVLSDKEMEYMMRAHQDRRWNFCCKPGEVEKSPCITANIHKGVPYNVCAEPINVTVDGKAQCIRATCYKDGIRNIIANNVDRKTGVAEPIQVPVMPVKEATIKGYTEIEIGNCVDLSMPNSKTRRGRNMKNKSNCMTTSNEYYQYIGYAIEFDDDGNPVKAIGKNGKEIIIYEVKNGLITVKNQQYPIKLRDGYYIIRKLTVSECKRLQTVPGWYEFPVSDSQAFKMLGNGWTVETIVVLIKACLEE